MRVGLISAGNMARALARGRADAVPASEAHWGRAFRDASHASHTRGVR